ncbi:hypothetical protein [Salinicola aestuarinus]|uniref:hypothetical protein n=1 Tax=Salinicola aestuarinus TaxID=1949082 RepID=UPI000DA21385|nr:hypothetical protein [Salinicola aestuarinus]
MNPRRLKWGIWAVVVLCYAVPYALLRDVAHWYGSFLFWGIAGLTIILLNVLMTADFNDRFEE